MPNILVIDDSPLICKIIHKSLSSSETNIVCVHKGADGIKAAITNVPDLILLDITMPDMIGYDVCTALQNNETTAELPIIFITSHVRPDDIAKGFSVGAVDYINKPFSEIELKARVTAHLKSKMMADNLRILNKSLHEALELNVRMAIEDPLTKLYNRRYAYDFLEENISNNGNPAQPVCLLIVDVDDFKQVNDIYGHNMGDYILYALAEIFQKIIDPKHLVCRWGGEEFLIALVDISIHESMCIAHDICSYIQNYTFSYEGFELKCSITIGIAPMNLMLPLERNINRADKALYYGKSHGKNQCVLYTSDMEPDN